MQKENRKERETDKDVLGLGGVLIRNTIKDVLNRGSFKLGECHVKEE